VTIVATWSFLEIVVVLRGPISRLDYGRRQPGTADAIMNEEVFFNSALEKPPGERAAYLDQVCAGRAALRERLEILLRAHDNPGSFLRVPEPGAEVTLGTHCGPAAFTPSIDGLEGNGPCDPRIVEAPGSRIGPYKLLQQIGEGGMGIVFMAEQTEPVQRRVALKVIKPGMDSRQVIARFEAERQALALMDHPNIAKVHDAATTDHGRPYFVMELVKGVPITRYCDERQLPPRARLELFMPVCRAVQHAHQKGIIHRDLKPSNVLIALYDGQPVPKVIDFGVAKATGPKLTERTLFTEFGSVVGTLEYMSPEQAELNQLDIDTRSDIYSLGVLLYELLTDTTPLERQRLKKTSLLEVLRLIREEDPPRPSIRLSSTQELATIAAKRGLDSAKLKGQIRGELDWIAMKALDKDRSRRYQTANALARDIERFLNDETVEACPPSTRYRLAKFSRRHKKSMALAGAFASLLTIAAAVGIYLAVRAMRAESQARSSQAQAEANLAKAHRAVNDFFTRVSDDTLLNEPQLEPLRKQLLSAALPYYDSFIREHRADPAFRAELAATYFRIAILTFEMGPEEDWVPAFKLGVSTLEELLRTNPDVSALQSLRSGFRWVNTSIHFHVRQADEALRQFEKARSLWQRLVREHPDVAGFKGDLAGVHLVLGILHGRRFHIEEAVRAYQAARALWHELIANDPTATRYPTALCIALASLSLELATAGKITDAEEVYAECIEMANRLSTDHPRIYAFQDLLSGNLELGLGCLKEHTRHYDEAVQAYRRAVAGQELLVRAFPSVARYREGAFIANCSLGEALWALGRRAEALAEFRKARAHGDELNKDDPVAQSELAWFLATAAEPQLRESGRAVDIARQVVERVPQDLGNWMTLGAAQYEAGDYQTAILSLEKATRGPFRSGGVADLFLARAYARIGQDELARACYERGVAHLDSRELQSAESRRHRADTEQLLARIRTAKSSSPADRTIH
jgi:serine/threonine protein kinase